MKELKNVIRTQVWKRIWKVLLIVLGSLLYGFVFQAFLFPNNIVAGGVTGIAMIVNTFTHWPIGVMVIVMNIPLFLIAWRHFGLDFLLGSLLGMGLSSAFVDLFALTDLVLTRDPMLASIIGGVLKGLSLGMIYFYGATTGGIDIVAKLLRQRFSQLNFGTIVLWPSRTMKAPCIPSLPCMLSPRWWIWFSTVWTIPAPCRSSARRARPSPGS